VQDDKDKYYERGKKCARRGKRFKTWEKRLIITRRWPEGFDPDPELVKRLANKNLKRDLRDREIALLLERSIGSIQSQRAQLKSRSLRNSNLLGIFIGPLPRGRKLVAGQMAFSEKTSELVMPIRIVIGNGPLFQRVEA